MKNNRNLIGFAFTNLILIFLIFATINAFSMSKYELNEINDIEYYENGEVKDTNSRLNIISPEIVTDAPVLIWIGGGAWAYVNRYREMELCRKIADKGIVVVSVGHRLSPALLGKEKNYDGIKHPEHVKDIAKAFAWVFENIEKYGGSKEKLFVGGFSSGAHLSSLLASDNTYLHNNGLSPKNIKAVIPVAGCYDVRDYRDVLASADSSYLENHIYPVFGRTDEEQINASPMTFIDSYDTNTLLIAEGESQMYSEIYETALKEKGFRKYQVLNLYNEGHTSLWTKMSNEENCIYRDYIVNYIFEMSSD